MAGDEFQPNEFVVYPFHGVGVVESIFEKADSSGNDISRFYRIQVEDSGMIISVPIDCAARMGLRRIISKNLVDEAIGSLAIPSGDAIEDNWKLRYQENVDRLKVGGVDDMIVVIRDLFLRNRIKALSVMERKLYENTYRMLVKEIMTSTELSEEQVTELITEKLNQLVKIS